MRNEKRRGTGVKRRGEWGEGVAKETGEMKERGERGREKEERERNEFAT